MDNQTNNGASIDFAKSGQILHLQNTIPYTIVSFFIQSKKKHLDLLIALLSKYRWQKSEITSNNIAYEFH